jgi:hypothetical protein
MGSKNLYRFCRSAPLGEHPYDDHTTETGTGFALTVEPLLALMLAALSAF